MDTQTKEQAIAAILQQLEIDQNLIRYNGKYAGRFTPTPVTLTSGRYACNQIPCSSPQEALSLLASAIYAFENGKESAQAFVKELELKHNTAPQVTEREEQAIEKHIDTIKGKSITVEVEKPKTAQEVFAEHLRNKFLKRAAAAEISFLTNFFQPQVEVRKSFRLFGYTIFLTKVKAA